MKFLIILLTVFLTACSTQKKVFICGDHECINKDEARMYFEKNLSIEVKIIENNKEEFFNLVKLNDKKDLKENKKNIKILKSKRNKPIRKLSKKEISKKKEEIKFNKKKYNKDKKVKKIVKKEIKSKTNKNSQKKKAEKKEKNRGIELTEYKNICMILNKCDIEEIGHLLIKEGNLKDYPDLNTR